MDKALAMDKLFRFLREFPEFENLINMEYDEKNGFVRAKIGIVEKVISIENNSTWMGITRKVLEELEKETLWSTYLDTMNGKAALPKRSQKSSAIPAGAIYGREITCTR